MTEKTFRNPFPTVDILIEIETPFKYGIVLIKRKNPPFGWAIPGGFVDYGESLEQAAVREATLEETTLKYHLNGSFILIQIRGETPGTIQLQLFSLHPPKENLWDRTMQIEAAVFSKDEIPENMAFDHRIIIEDYYSNKILIKTEISICRFPNSCLAPQVLHLMLFSKHQKQIYVFMGAEKIPGTFFSSLIILQELKQLFSPMLSISIPKCIHCLLWIRHFLKENLKKYFIKWEQFHKRP